MSFLDVYFYTSRQQRGSTMMGMLFLALIGSLVAMSLLQHATQHAHATRHALHVERARVAVDHGLDYSMVKLQELMALYRFSLTDAEMETLLATSFTAPPPLGSYVFESPSGDDTAFNIRVVQHATEGPVPSGTIRNLTGKHITFELAVGAVHEDARVGAVVKQVVQVSSVFLMRYGVFYDDVLAIHPGPEMNFYGQVHSNGDVYLGGRTRLHETLTSAGKIFHRPDGDAQVADAAGTLHSFFISDAEILDSRHDNWVLGSMDRWDENVRSAAHGISTVRPPIDPHGDNHDIIERPLDVLDPGYSALTEQEKFANRAAVRIHVDSSRVISVTDYYGYDITHHFNEVRLTRSGTYDGQPTFVKDAEGQYALHTPGSYRITAGRMTDMREEQGLHLVDLYLDEFQAAYPELYSGLTYGETQGRGMVYITVDDRGRNMGAVRLRNGKEIIPDAGLSFMSDRPIYIEGDYNTVHPKPSLIAGDAVTILSNIWQDALSHVDDKKLRPAVATECNAVIMTGNSTATLDGVGNGGLQNALRFLEFWKNHTMTYRGSIINLWLSEVADGSWHLRYYYPPDRDWGFDPLYLTQAPPGMTRGIVYDAVSWHESSWGSEGWE